MTTSGKYPLRRRWGRTLILWFIGILIVCLLATLGGAAWFYTTVYAKTPDIGAVTDYRPKIPLRIYTSDNVLIGEFGEEHRDFVAFKDVPLLTRQAVLAIEDARFYEHGGIDWIRAMGAARANLRGGFRQGASTITMQVARNFFLSRDKKISRKINEIALAWKIEQVLSKDQILELYLNQIFMGRRSYGFASAARAYFGKDLPELSVAELAMLAGVPQDPVRHNPAVNPHRAKQRQEAVLKRMYELGFISTAQFNEAMAAPIKIATARQEFGTHAEYVAELVRQQVVAEFKDDAYTRGLVVVTTIGKAEQDAAYESVRRNVLAYDQRHGYRGPEAFITLPADPRERDDAIADALRARPVSDGLLPVMVLQAGPQRVTVETIDGERIEIGSAGLRLVAAGLSDKARPALRLREGAIVRIAREGKGWAIVQVPQVAAAFVALDAATGAYRALVGGFDYNLQKFNHVTQAWRQPGSAIKPFVYSAALEKGFSPSTRILDEALEMPGMNGGATWSPQNDDGTFEGQVSMRRSLAHSKNVPTVRLLRAVGIDYAHTYMTKFGFTEVRHPKNLTLALGTGAVTPQQLAGAYAVFANGGYRVRPWLIAAIRTAEGLPLFAASQIKPDEFRRVLDARNAFIVDSMLRDVTRYGTAAAATQRLARADLAGKTGTTSDAIDGWFAGYGGSVVGVAWMGYDEPRSLGGREFGATLAMPIWIDYMRVALERAALRQALPPPGLVREDDDWIYAESAGKESFKTIDFKPLPPLDALPEEAAPPISE